MPHLTHRLRALLCLLPALVLLLAPTSANAWGPMHSAITEAAFNALPQWQQHLLADQRSQLIEFDCMIPDLVRAPAQRKTLGRFALLPNGDPFTHEPHSRAHNAAQMTHYFQQAVDHVAKGDLAEASRYAGCLLHFLEDCGSPAHSIPGDNQHGLMQDLLEVPPAFRDRPLHGLIEEGSLPLSLASYQPVLLGSTTHEAVFHLVERLNASIRNARHQLVPILQGVFRGDQPAVDAARRNAALMDAQVAADALHTILAIGSKRFDPAALQSLAQVDLTPFTPLETLAQSYLPQFAYFSNPYFGFPVRNALLKDGRERLPLVLSIANEGTVATRTFPSGLSLGTSCRLSYALPEKVYDRFTCHLGLHPELGREGRVNFRISADGVPVFESGPLSGADPARSVDLPLWRVQKLSIEVQSAGTAPAASNYAILATPLLHKAHAPPRLDQDKTR